MQLHKIKMADFIEVIGHLNFGPGRDAQQNFFSYQFGFLLNPVKRNHPRTEYLMVRMNSSVLAS